MLFFLVYIGAVFNTLKKWGAVDSVLAIPPLLDEFAAIMFAAIVYFTALLLYLVLSPLIITAKLYSHFRKSETKEVKKRAKRAKK